MSAAQPINMAANGGVSHVMTANTVKDDRHLGLQMAGGSINGLLCTTAADEIDTPDASSARYTAMNY